MKKIFAGCMILVSASGYTQTPATQPVSFAKSLGIYVFPAKNQGGNGKVGDGEIVIHPATGEKQRADQEKSRFATGIK